MNPRHRLALHQAEDRIDLLARQLRTALEGDVDVPAALHDVLGHLAHASHLCFQIRHDASHPIDVDQTIHRYLDQPQHQKEPVT